MSPSPNSIVLVANTHQARKVRWVFWGCALFFAGFAYWGWDLSQTYGLSPGDGGVLKPLSSRLTAAAILLVLGLLPFVGMVAYVRRYVASLIRQGDDVIVSGVGWPARERRVPLASVEAGRDYDGRFDTIVHRVDAPWMTVSLGGRTYIVDLQAEHVDRPGLALLFKDAHRRRARSG